MVAGLAFLSKKGFNPANKSNQKAVWEAQQQKEHEIKRAKEREDQLRRERDDEELARARGGDRGGDQATLRFMYAPPPGLAPGPTNDEGAAVGGNDDLGESTPSNNTETNNTSASLTTSRQPGDDDAAAAFRQMLAAATAKPSSAQDRHVGELSQSSGTYAHSSGAALTGTTIENSIGSNNQELTALEKAVGRRDANSSLTLEEQIARFPQLKNAPMAKGMNATNVNVTFKPLGTQLRNVRCLACGVWGHARGDRECQLSGWDPFSSSSRPPQASTTATSTITGTAMEGQERTTQKQGDAAVESTAGEVKRRDRERDDESDSNSDSDDSYQRRKRHRKHHKSRRHRHESKRRKRSRSSSPEERRRSRKSSHKRSRKHSRHD